MQNDRDGGREPMEKAERLAQEVCEGRLSRREFLARTAALGLGASAVGALLAACGSSATTVSTSSSAPAPMDTTLPKKLFIYNWSDYSSQRSTTISRRSTASRSWRATTTATRP